MGLRTGLSRRRGRGVSGLARRRGRRRAGRARGSDQPAHAARRRAGRQLSFRRARQLARRGARPARQGRAVQHLLAALRGRGVRRDRVPAADGAAARQRAPRGASSRARHRASLPDVIAHTERPILRTAPAPLFLLSRWCARRHQGRADRRGRRRDVRRLRPVPRSARCAASGRASRSRPGARGLLERLYPYLAPIAGRAAGDGAAVLRPRARARWREPGFAHEPRWRGAAALQRLFSPAMRRPWPGAMSAASCSRRCRRSLRAGRRSRRTSTSRSARCSSGYLLSSQGDRMLMAQLGRGPVPVPRSPTWSRSPSRCRPPTSCACSTRSTCSSARRAAWCRRRSWRARSSRTARRTRCRSPARGAEWIDEVASPSARCRRRRLRAAGARAAARQVPRAGGDGPVLERRQHGGRRPAVDAAGLRPVHSPAPDARRGRPFTNPRGSRGGCSSDFTVTSAGPREAQAPQARLAVGRI